MKKEIRVPRFLGILCYIFIMAVLITHWHLLGLLVTLVTLPYITK